MVSDKAVHKALEFITFYKQNPLEKFYYIRYLPNYTNWHQTRFLLIK